MSFSHESIRSVIKAASSLAVILSNAKNPKLRRDIALIERG